MKTSILYLTLTLLISLISAAPVTQGTVSLAIITTTPYPFVLTLPFGTLFDASASPKALSVALANSTDTPISFDTIVCQAFSDTSGTELLGGSFMANTPQGAFEANVPGLQVNSVFCSSAAGVTDFVASTAAATPPAPTPTAHIQLTSAHGNSSYGAVPLGSFAVPAAEVFGAGTAAISASVVLADGIDVGKVDCEAYTDVAALNRVGDGFQGGPDGQASDLADSAGGDVVVGAIWCFSLGGE